MNATSPPGDLFKAAQITIVFLSLYSATFVNVLANKKKGLRANKHFDRYNSPVMLVADRLNANFLEWSPVFLGLIWSLAATDNLGAVWVSWAYVGLRALYMVLMLKYGVASNGMNKKLWVSTFRLTCV